VLTLYDAARCPYCARVRIVLAEKQIEYETVEIDLDHRPAWLVDLNPPSGRVPVLEEDGLVLPESAVLMEFLEERYPEPALLPVDPAERALARLAIQRFDDFGDPYYDLYFERPAGSVERIARQLTQLDRRLEQQPFLAGRAYGLADIGYVPWILRLEPRLGIDVSPYEAVSSWLARLVERPAIAAEAGVVAALWAKQG
jgi:RNA polymerase-associated protein